jgi:hypothetical protein
MANDTVGLFIASYDVSTGLPGAPVLHLRLVVSTPQRKVTGAGTVTQAVAKPDVFSTSLFGTFEPLALMPPAPTNILVTLDGLPLGTPQESGIAETAHLRMLLDESWKAGVATFRWLQGGEWHEIENGKVTLVQPASIDEVGQIDLTKGKSRAKAGAKR